MFCIFFLLTLALVCAGDEDGCDAEQNDRWSYRGRNGPDSWSTTFPQCGGYSQSPINIEVKNTKHDDNLSSLKFIKYNVPLKSARIENNGHTAQLTPTDGEKRMIKGGGLSGDYLFQQLHFHWGYKEHRGSEHTVNGYRYDMEVHLVHTNANNRTAVVAIFIKKAYKENKRLEPIIQSLEKVKYKNENSTLPHSLFRLFDLMPHDKCFYRYMGSLTTPGCTEGVTWSVLTRPITMGYKQMEKFWNLTSTERSLPPNQQCFLRKNYRPLQQLNGRPVTFSHC